MFGDSNDRTAIGAAIRLRGECFRGITKDLGCDRFGLSERVTGRYIDRVPAVGRCLLGVNVNRAAPWFNAGGVLSRLPRRRCVLVRILGRLQDHWIRNGSSLIRFLFLHAFAVVLKFLRFLLQNGSYRTVGRPRGQNRSAGQILLSDRLVPLERQNEIRRLGGVVSRAEDLIL